MSAKRLSITHSEEIKRRLEEAPPTVGMLVAFQFGCNLYMAVHGQKFPPGSIKPLISKGLDTAGAEIILRTCLMTWLRVLDTCKRVTLAHSFCASPSPKVAPPDVTFVRLEVKGYSEEGQREVVHKMFAFFNPSGEVYLEQVEVE